VVNEAVIHQRRAGPHDRFAIKNRRRFCLPLPRRGLIVARQLVPLPLPFPHGPIVHPSVESWIITPHLPAYLDRSSRGCSRFLMVKSICPAIRKSVYLTLDGQTESHASRRCRAHAKVCPTFEADSARPEILFRNPPQQTEVGRSLAEITAASLSAPSQLQTVGIARTELRQVEAPDL